MTSVQWEPGTDTTVMSTSLNSLADDSNVVSSEIDNTAALFLFDEIEWHNATMTYAPAADSVIELYCVSLELDGAGYEDGESGGIDPPQVNLVGIFELRSVTTAQTHILRQIPISPNKYKYVVINKTGQTLASSGNTLRIKPYRYKTT